MGWDYKYPKVAAIYKEEDDPEDSRVKVAVSGMVWLDDASYWSLGIWFMQWSGDDFQDGTMGDPDDEWGVLIPAVIDGSMVDRVDAISHDIAFDPETQDLWIIYSSDDHTPFGNPVKLKCRKYVQQALAFQWEEDEDFRGYAYDPGIDCSCYFPNVDVGAIALDDGLGWYVVVAFTAIDHPEANANFCVGGNYWMVTETGDHTDYDYYYDGVDGENCGAPVIDIAPYYFQHDYYALVWIQKLPDDPPPDPVRDWDVYFVDSFSNLPIRVARNEEDSRNKTLPSVACHYREYNEDPYASVSMYEAGIDEGDYRPTACRVTIDETSPYNPTVANFSTIPLDVGSTWNPGSIIRADNGVSTDIVIFESNYYYLGFSDTISGWPGIVYAAYGNTE